MIKQAVKVTLADDVVKQLGSMIQSGAWPPGYQLPPERQLVEQFGVSRNTLREALKALSLMGVLESRQGGGNYVSTDINRRIVSASFQFLDLQDGKNIFDLLETRRTIEVRTAYLAAKDPTPELISALQQDNICMKENVQDTNEASKYDMDFHFRIAQATGNVFYEEISRILYTPAVSLMRETTLIRSLMNCSVAYHDLILDAIAKRDPDLSAEYMYKHLKTLEAALQEQGLERR